MALPSYCAFYIAFGTLSIHFLTKNATRRVLLFPVLWSLFEWIRGHVLLDFPWNLIGYTLYVQLETVQAASLVGAYGLSFIAALIFAFPVLYFIEAKKKYYFISSASIFALLWGFGAYRLNQPILQEKKGPLVRLVQGNIPQKFKWSRSFASRSLYAYFSLSFPTKEEKTPTLFIWPEAAIPFYVNEQDFIRHEISKRMPRGSFLVIGTLRKTIQKHPVKLYNSLLVLDDRGRVLSIYDKTHLVPFGEYIPLKKWLPFKKITHGLLDISAGKELKTVSVKGLPFFSPLICYEGIFPGDVKERGNRPDWLINITNDAWFGDSNGPHQHLDIIRLRSIEEGLPIGRVAGTGITALIDSYGRILNKIGLHKPGVIDGHIPGKIAPTLYAKFGDWVFFIILLFWSFLAPSNLLTTPLRNKKRS